ncbi:MAG: protein translocase subunit SecD [Candidatus Azosocius agrarius]|nr:MAG: protein translocase subunit SecD [Gammaproteobacteria bacterium]
MLFYYYKKLFNFKIIFFIFLFLISCLYFIPNLYKEDLIISVSSDLPFIKEDMDNILLFVKKFNFEIKNNVNNNLSIKCSSFEEQLLLKSNIENYLNNKNVNYNIILDSISSIPLWFNYIHAKPIKLGLDLKGGIRFLMGIDFDFAVIKNTENYYNDIRNLFKREDIFYSKSNCLNKFFEFKFNVSENLNLAMLYIKNNYPDLTINVDYKKNIIGCCLNNKKIENLKFCIMEKSLFSFRKRVNELGLSDVNIRSYGENNILIELPGMQNIDRARNILGKTATINFFILDQEHIYNTINKYIPINSKLLYDRNGHPVLLKKKIILSGDFIINAYSGLNNDNKPYVNVKLDNIGAKKFFEVTSKNIDKLMAVVYCESFNDVNQDHQGIKIKEEIISIGKIMQPLNDNFQITGLNLEEANDLALLLRSGVLPTNIIILEEKVIGPTLGKENVNKGYNSIIYGLAVILCFMIFYYNVFGVIANICLIFNLIFLIACMSILDAVLTLPGIAGIVLTLGMAIDSNVLIFERIRERLLSNDNCQFSIKNGYKYAFVTIVDSNLTTFLVGFILFIIGDGPIRGFAITLCIGIITSLYSSIVGSRIIIDIIFKNNIKKLPIGL